MAFNNAPMSGFPAQKKPLPLDQSTATQGPGLPPPPPPNTPDVPKMPLTAANGWGTGMTDSMGSTNMANVPGFTGPTKLGGGTNGGTGTPGTAVGGSGSGVGATGTAGSPLDTFSSPSGMSGPVSAGTASPLNLGNNGGMPLPQTPPDLNSFMAQQPAPLPTTTPYTGQMARLQAPPQATQMESATTPTTQPSATPAPTTTPYTGPTVNTQTASTPPAPASGSGDINFTDWMAAHTGSAVAPQPNSPPTTTPTGGGDAGNPTNTTPPANQPSTQIPDTTGQKPPVNNSGAGSQPSTPTPAPTVSTNPADYKAATTPYDQNIADWNTQLGAWLKNNMSNASPYSTDLIKQGQQVLDDAINRQTAAGQRQIEEYMASRGLTGSALEASTMKDYQAQMQEQYRQGQFQLGQAQVDAYLKQEQTVGSLANQYMSGLTDEQRNALSSVTSQMSLAMQKYGIDKSSADAAAQRETQKFIAEEGLVAQYGGTPSQAEWDSFNAMFPGDAQTYLGPRPGGAATGTGTGTGTGTTPSTATTPGTSTATGPTPGSTATVVDAAPGADQAAADYKAEIQNPPAGKTAAQVYDEYTTKYGPAAASRNLGPRPAGPTTPVTFSNTSTAPSTQNSTVTNSMSTQATTANPKIQDWAKGLSSDQYQNWMREYASGHDILSTDSGLAERRTIWDATAKNLGPDKATAAFGPRP